MNKERAKIYVNKINYMQERPYKATGYPIRVWGGPKAPLLLWLDDARDPAENDGEWLVFSPIELPVTVRWAQSYQEFVDHIELNGLPAAICFDHDLGMNVAIAAREKGMSKRKSRRLKREEKTGYDCAKWLVEYCMDRNLDIPPYNVQSANPVGKENIIGLLENYKSFKAKQNNDADKGNPSEA